ncbi:TolC family protein [Verrucomicrobia bacterium]|nr:TolC family protein [Verrucomicrobiota bacterium]
MGVKQKEKSGWIGLIHRMALIGRGFIRPLALCVVMHLGPIVESAVPEFRIAVVRDDDSWYFDAMVANFISELEPLAKGNYEVTIDERFNAKGDFSTVPDLIREVMADPTIDLVYTGGVAATEIAATLPDSERVKPVIGGALQMVDITWMPISEEGASEIPNYTFITNPQRVEADLKLLQRLVSPETVHILIDEPIVEYLSILDKGTAHFESLLELDLVVTGAGLTAAETLESLPEGIEAAYVTLLPRMVDSERKALFRGLAERGIPTVSMYGLLDVELGALGGMEPDSHSAVARRIALNIHQLLLGVKTGNLPVYLPVQDRMVINMETARLTGWSPSYRLSLEASFLNPEPKISTRPLTLEDAMARARDSNARVRIAREDPVIRKQESLVTRGNLLPSTDLISRFGGSRFSDITNPLLTPSYANQGSLGIQLRQLLYSDTVISAYRAQKRAVKSAEFQLESMQLDAIFDAVGAYLDVLGARALRTIEQNNLSLTENNLSLAKLRKEIGAAEPAELFRWERDQARNRGALIQRDYQVKNAMIALNQVMGTPREQVWNLTDIDLENDQMYFLGDEVYSLIQNLDKFERFGMFLMQYSVLASPELASFDFGLIGQGILLRQKKRQYFVPDIALSASADRVSSKSSFQGLDGQNETTVGIEMSFPLFTGGARRAALKKQEAELRQLNEQREQAVQQIELAALSAKNNIGQTHPSIRLNRLSLDSAEKLYRSVLQKYSVGATDYLKLLDAQQALLEQQQQASLAVYRYLLEIHRVQRAIAWFEFDKTDAEKDSWLGLLTEFLESEPFPKRAVESLGVGGEIRRSAESVVGVVDDRSKGKNE